VTVKRLVAFALLAFALAGCGSKSSDEQPATTNPTSTTTASTTASCQPLAGASLNPKKGPAQMNPVTVYLTDVSIEQKTCSDQVVFGFEDGHGPGYDVSYQPATTAKVEDASGNPVEIAGDAFLVVKLTPVMTAKIDGDQVTKTYTGPKRLAGADPITEVVKTGDFESVVTWVIGLDQKRSFTTSTSGSKLVVEIDHVLP